MATSDGGVQANAQNQANAAQTRATTAFNSVSPLYSELAQGNTGYTPQQKSDMQTALLQSAGGGVAAATGQGGLLAARTGNAGAAAASIAAAARDAQVTQSQGQLQLGNQNAQLEEQNRLAGLSGLTNLYSDADQAGQGYLNTANNAQENGFGKQLINGVIQQAGGAGQAFLGKK